MVAVSARCFDCCSGRDEPRSRRFSAETLRGCPAAGLTRRHAAPSDLTPAFAIFRGVPRHTRTPAMRVPSRHFQFIFLQIGFQRPCTSCDDHRRTHRPWGKPTPVGVVPKMFAAAALRDRRPDPPQPARDPDSRCCTVAACRCSRSRLYKSSERSLRRCTNR